MKTTASPIGHQVHQFESYPRKQKSRSKFDRSHSLITDFNAGKLIPIWHDFAYPGDTLDVSVTSVTRLATQLVPFMSNVFMDVHFWAVPVRLIWDNWKKFNGERVNPDDSIDYLTPQLNSGETGVAAQSIYDYFNIPINVPNLNFNSFNFRAYQLVWNEWYRDENLQNSIVVNTGDTDLDNSVYTLLPRGKRKDYFTSALPFLQKGEAMTLPIGNSAPVYGNGLSLSMSDGINLLGSISSGNSVNFQVGDFGRTVGSAYQNTEDIINNVVIGLPTKDQLGSNLANSGLIADLSQAQGITLEQFRQANAVQKVLELDARCGTRYIEFVLGHFGVESPDGRLQRPEFLGGGTFDLNLNVVAQTSSTDTTSPQGKLSSFGVINGRTRRIVRSFTEHTIVFAVASIRSEYYYQFGLERDYSKRSRFDYYLPILANLGEQAILNKEIYAQGTDADEDVFGYQERWAEMRYKNSYITGNMRSSANQSLDIWHLGQDYSSLPLLNSDFITENPPLDRVIAVNASENTPQFIANFYFNEYWTRCMPVYSIPSLNSHF